MHGQARGERGFLQRIGLGARLFRRDIDRDHVVAALEQCFEHGFAEGLLAVNDDTHADNPLGEFLHITFVMAELVRPSTSCFAAEDVDARHEAGHDDCVSRRRPCRRS